MALTGQLFIGRTRRATARTFQAADPARNTSIEPAFSAASIEDVQQACELAWTAFDGYRALPTERRAKFLESIADNILGLGDELLQRAHVESGLPLARLTGERGRTVNQLKLFASELRRGGWHAVHIDPALPTREPLPRSDLRQRQIPLGPVAVFGASNFPLAFSVAGGDTAAALAAGCPVIVKGHSAHPGTSELVASAIIAAAHTCDMPDGVFSLLNGNGQEVGGALVAHPHIKAVGFTGSRNGGLALMKIAAARPEPIPVYAEMSSINPVLLLPHALQERATSIAQGFIGSLTMGSGQFCTNPGLLLALEGAELEQFIAAASPLLSQAPATLMLTAGIHSAYRKGVEQLSANEQVTTVAQGQSAASDNCGQPVLFSVTADAALGDSSILQEVFGAASILVRCRDEAQLHEVLEHLEGQLTATLYLSDADQAMAQRLLPILERKAGRILANGWPTGVEVCHAMVHGGPFPATSDSRSTSVGTRAIERFLRPVCYQDIPQALLPEVLRDGAQQQLPHRLDGVYHGAQ